MTLDRRQFVVGLGALAIGCRHAPPRATPTPVEAAELDLGPWREGLAHARRLQIARLDAYAARKQFPTNHRVLGHTPVFIDFEHRNTPCAVGYLMIESGWQAEALDVARTNNHVLLETVKEGKVIEWIERSGLTHEECAFIQPKYGCNMRPNGCQPPREPTELERLVHHFDEVHERLVADTDTSLELALARLTPAIRGGRGGALITDAAPG